MVCREPLGRQEVWFVENSYGWVNGADAVHKLSFERDGNGHSL